MKTILSISGGGMRGVIPAQWLILLESKLGPVWEWADLVAGTSTGGILALLMGADVSALRAMDFYCMSGPKIFRASALRRLYSGGGLLHTKYRSDVLAQELGRSLGPGTLASVKTKLMVTAMTNLRDAVMVKSWLPEWQDLSLVDAALMTSAAQTYFPQSEWRGVRYLDGGNVRNNPSVCALTESLKLWPGEKLRLIHLGTGHKAQERPLPNGGALGWAAEIFDTLTHGDDSYDDYHCRVLAEVLPIEYIRADVALDEIPALDDASGDTLRKLRQAASEGWPFLEARLMSMFGAGHGGESYV